MYMYMYVYIYIYIYIYMCMYIYIYIYMYTCLFTTNRMPQLIGRGAPRPQKDRRRWRTCGAGPGQHNPV